MNIKEVAKAANVSITTVSRVLNNPDAVSKDTQDRVLSVMKELNYIPNWFARNLQNARTNVIGVIVPDVMEESNMELVKGVEKVTLQKKSNIILCTSEFSKEKEIEHIHMLVERKIDGLILISSKIDKNTFKIAKEKNCPMVFIGKTKDKFAHNMVYTNYDSASKEVVEYLIKMGKQRIAIVLTNNHEVNNNEKLKGYREALLDNNISFDDNLVLTEKNTIEGGYIALSKLLESNNKPDAVFLATDTMAFGAIEKLKEENIDCKEIGIVGFDDLKVGAVMDPKLTTVSKPSYRMGLTAARMLFDNIEENEENFEDFQEVMLQSKLKIRKSCGNEKRLNEIW